MGKCSKDKGSNRLSCEQAREMDMVVYLSAIGFEPAKIRGNNYWYSSLLRNERTPSFKVNRSLNRWYDFGEGKGGNLIDFGVAYYRCTVSELLSILSSASPVPASSFRAEKIPSKGKDHSKILVTMDKPLRSLGLLHYLTQRCVTLEIAKTFCREISFTCNGKNQTAIGFKNDGGGYEIRNKTFKGSSSPKGVTTIPGDSQTVHVFEGFFDFLSYLTFFAPAGRNDSYIILNSLAFFDGISGDLEISYMQIILWMDNDSAGQRSRDVALKRSPKYIDASSYYKAYKDLNDWICGKKLPGSLLEGQGQKE